MKKIILFSGKARNGKTETSKLFKKLLEERGEKVLIIPFAKYLKQYLVDYYNWDGHTHDTDFRANAQYLGTDIIRHKLNKPLFHVNRICEDIEIIGDRFDYIIIDDARFLNEITYTMAKFPHQTISIRVERVNFNSNLTPEQLAHSSETDLDNFKGFDYKIFSKNGIENLEFEATKVFNQIMNDIGEDFKPNTITDYTPSIPPKEGDVWCINGVKHKYINNTFIPV